MASHKKTLEKVLSGTSDKNVRFDDLRALLLGLGFEERVRSSHRIFRRHDIDEIVTLQPKGSKAKAYQVRQVRQLIIRHGLRHHGDE